jgi:thiosulfate/3-mercaptopyruvate sulfurtransferase
VFAAQGIDANAPSVSYCNTGHMAAGSWFIQSEILGNPQVRLYDGSMHEWTTLGRPVVGLGG